MRQYKHHFVVIVGIIVVFILQGKLERCPTPYPKEMKQRAQHMRNLAMKQSTPNGEVRWNTAERKVEKQVMEKIAVYSKVKVLKLMIEDLFIVLRQ